MPVSASRAVPVPIPVRPVVRWVRWRRKMTESRGNHLAPPLLRAAHAPQRRHASSRMRERRDRRPGSLDPRGAAIAYGTGTNGSFCACRAHRSSLTRIRRPPGSRAAADSSGHAPSSAAGPHVHILLRLESRLPRRGRPLARPARAPHPTASAGAVRRASASRRSSSRDSFGFLSTAARTAPAGRGGCVVRVSVAPGRARIPVRLYPKRRVPDRPAEEGRREHLARGPRHPPPSGVARHDSGMAKARRALLPVTEGKRSIRTFRDARSKALKDDPFFRA